MTAIGTVEPVRAVLRHNAVALISLVVALSGLGYNTWRNETTESHRNTRQAAFMMLVELGGLQQLVDERFYGGRRDELTRIQGWGKVALLRDIGPLVSADAGRAAEALLGTWQEQLPRLDAGESGAERAVSAAVRATREQVMAELMTLR